MSAVCGCVSDRQVVWWWKVVKVAFRGPTRKCIVIWLLCGALMVRESKVSLQMVITNGILSIILSFLLRSVKYSWTNVLELPVLERSLTLGKTEQNSMCRCSESIFSCDSAILFIEIGSFSSSAQFFSVPCFPIQTKFSLISYENEASVIMSTWSLSFPP